MDVRSDFTLAINGVTADFGNETLRDKSGNSIALRPQAFAVLRYLSESANRLVTKDELMRAVWPGIAVTDDSLVQCVHEIRRALDDDGHAILTTVPKRGYRLVLPANPVSDNATAPPPASHAPFPATVRFGRIPIAIAAILIVLAGAALSWWLLGGAPKPAGPPVIAVLPFENLGAEPAGGYFADGITEDLITDLSKLSGLYVIARNSVWSYRGKPVDIQEVATNLGARYVLEGSVRREAGQVRINAQLIDTATGIHLWADRYDGTPSDVFKLQDQVIGKIVSALAVKLTSDETASTDDIETANPLAYDAVLQGLDYLHRNTEDATVEAIKQFERAVALDPHYARAHAALAAAHWRVVQSFWFTSSGPGWVHAYEAYKQHLALALEKPSAIAYATQAWQFQFEGRYDEAFAAIDKAMSIAPGDADNHAAKARVLNAVGRAEDAEAEVRLAMRLDPGFAPATLRVLSISLLHQKRYQESVDTVARIMAQGAIELEDYWTLASAYGHLGRVADTQQAIADYNKVGVPAYFDPLTVQEAQWFWGGDAFDYYAPYMDDILDGLRKGGAPVGPGADLPLASYKGLMTRVMGEYEVKGVTKVDAPTAKALQDRGVKFVDTRSHLEYLRSHVPGAFGLSLAAELSKDALARVVNPSEEVVFYCHGKYCPVSAYSSAKAIVWGWTHVYYFADGFPGWQDAGYPVEETGQKKR